MLSKEREKTVSEIASILHISIKATSNHLVILKNLDIVEAEGRAGHVWYRLNARLPEDFHDVVSLFLLL